jgi:hypothetical protein
MKRHAQKARTKEREDSMCHFSRQEKYSEQDSA